MATATGVAAPVAAAAASTKKAPKQLPAPNSDFYQLADVLTAEEKAIVKKVRTYMETKVQPIINNTGPTTHFRSSTAVIQGTPLGGLGIRGLRLRGREPETFRLRRDGAGAGRCFVLYVLRRARRPGDGLDLSRWIGGAETEMAAADGAPRKDRLLRPDRAAGGLGSSGGLTTTAKREGRYLGPQRRETMDRQRAVVRPFDHLGARCRRQPSQGLHRREQDHAGLQRREDRAQDRT